MPIPAEILAVSRPSGTKVRPALKSGLYPVIERKKSHRIGNRVIPEDGPVVGHINPVTMVYMAREDEIAPVASDPVELKYWANITVLIDLSNDLLDELHQFYNEKESQRIYCMALLQVCEPSIKDSEFEWFYKISFLSEYYPHVSLSKNTICTFLRNLGTHCQRIRNFMQHRADQVAKSNHILIDGTLKTDDSNVNTLSNYSRKAKKKQRKDISVLYAFDFEKMEPICSECYPGNMIDATDYSSFIEDNHIEHGILIGDKGFPAKMIEEHLQSHPQLHYMNPIKRNAKVIQTYGLYDYEGTLQGNDDILYKKVKLKKVDKWYYSFKNISKAHTEEFGYVERAKKRDDFDLDDWNSKRAKSGTIILESDQDLTPAEAYKIYSYRWEIELVMRTYKMALKFDETRVQDDFSVIGAEFIDFLSVVITYRLLNKIDELGLFENNNYKSITRALKRGEKVKNGQDWDLIKMNPKDIKIIEAFGLDVGKQGGKK